MKHLNKTITILLALCPGFLQAAATLHPLFADRAVLQRDTGLPVFGFARPGEKVAVTLGTKKASTRADAEGKWRVVFPASPASAEGQLLEARGEDGKPARANDVLLGDVWLLGGQSNMRTPFKSFTLLKDKTAAINDQQMRLLVITDSSKSATSGTASIVHPLYAKAWQSASSPWVDEFSPTGYYFGAALRRELKVPIGLVLSSVGGTQIERWIPTADLKKIEPNAFLIGEPGDLYAGMIEPLRGFAWRGVAWYQGESNSRDPLCYAPLLQTLISGWRRELLTQDRQFIVVQIAPYEGGKGQLTSDTWAWLRDQQSMVARQTNKVGLVVTLDLGEALDIHPQNKEPVGERMARWALRDFQPTLQAASPHLLKSQISGESVVLTFCETGGGLEAQRVALNRKGRLPFGTDPEAAIAPAEKLVGFEMCGPDGLFHPAQAAIDAETVTVKCPEVKTPVGVRYAWANFPLGNLFGKSGLPAEPFRTDKLPAPDFGLPLEGKIASGEIEGTPLVLIQNSESTLEPVKTVDGRQAHTVGSPKNPESKFKGRYVYAKLPEGFSKEGKKLQVAILFHDDFRSSVRVRYDSADAAVLISQQNPGAFKELGNYRMKGSGRWLVAEFSLSDGQFQRRCNGGDFRLESINDRDLVIGGMYVRPMP